MTMPLVSADLLASARTFLFVPGDRPERIPKALASGADVVIVDLEDAVSPTKKENARSAIKESFGLLSAYDRASLCLRVNAVGSQWFASDVQLVEQLSSGGLGGVVVPKVESASSLSYIADRGKSTALLPLIESGAGLDAIGDIARAKNVVRLILGHLDLQNDLGIACAEDELEIAPARWELVRVSRRAGLAPPVDGVTTDTRNLQVTRRDTERSIRYGFAGKLCIHPAQVAAIHAAFTPSNAEHALAVRILEAAAAAKDGVCMVDGRMVDMPVIVKAKRTIVAHTRALEGSA